MVTRAFTHSLRAALISGVALSALAAVVACKPDFAERASEIRGYRILAIRSEPAEWLKVLDPDTGEAKRATYTALVVNPLGTLANENLHWAFCTLPKPLTELNDVSIACFQESAEFITPIGNGPLVSAAVPDNACRQFGPDTPEDQAYRPADPDGTGGYYQPIRALYYPQGDIVVPALEKARIKCGLPGASQEQTSVYNRTYHVNGNPTVDSLTAVSASGEAKITAREDQAEAAPLVIPAGASVDLRAAWASCPTTDACGDGYCGPTEAKDGDEGACAQDCSPEKKCTGAERYVAFDLETRALRERREAMRLSWFVVQGGGTVRDDRTGADESETAVTTANRYTAPSTPGDYPLWLVLRDSRGGVGWKSYTIHVE